MAEHDERAEDEKRTEDDKRAEGEKRAANDKPPHKLGEDLGPPGHRAPEPPIHEDNPFKHPLSPGRAGWNEESVEKFFTHDDQQRTTDAGEAAQKNIIPPKLAR